MIKRRGLRNALTTGILLAALLFGWFNRLAIYDWFRLRNYKAPSDIVALADADTMTSFAKHILYVNHPLVENRADFNSNCPNNGGERTIILGCYHTHEMGIFVYQVGDTKLNGVEQVTLAHETLHAIYERLSPYDKSRVNAMLEDYFRNGLTNSRITNTIAAYKKFEPNSLDDEMHSIFGTEVGNLPPKLEEYYSKYFKNRSTVVAFSTKYQSIFNGRKAEAAALLAKIHFNEQQLASLRTQIDSMQQSLETQSQDLNNRRHTNQDISSFNSQVAAFNEQVSKYKDLVAEYNQLIAQHNDLVNQYNAINIETNQLLNELNSRSPAVTTQ